ncbi:MAG: hypothetical protein ABS35_17300 [Kaistia sp. SCN 65-12]|nr:MAG: hypothetical protein ABS35_17300 [Kaistia sp. SCN 65-12]
MVPDTQVDDLNLRIIVEPADQFGAERDLRLGVEDRIEVLVGFVAGVLDHVEDAVAAAAAATSTARAEVEKAAGRSKAGAQEDRREGKACRSGHVHFSLLSPGGGGAGPPVAGPAFPVDDWTAALMTGFH